MLTTYTVKSKKDAYIWEFNYCLNGNLKAFKVLEGILTAKQMKWLFSSGNFPTIESVMTTVWIPNLKQNFEISVGEIDLSFDNFWNSYGNKVGRRKETRNAWDRLPKADKIKTLLSIPRYQNYLRYFPKQQKAYPSTYLSQEYYLNDWKV